MARMQNLSVFSATTFKYMFLGNSETYINLWKKSKIEMINDEMSGCVGNWSYQPKKTNILICQTVHKLQAILKKLKTHLNTLTIGYFPRTFGAQWKETFHHVKDRPHRHWEDPLSSGRDTLKDFQKAASHI